MHIPYWDSDGGPNLMVHVLLKDQTPAKVRPKRPSNEPCLDLVGGLGAVWLKVVLGSMNTADLPRARERSQVNTDRQSGNL